MAVLTADDFKAEFDAAMMGDLIDPSWPFDKAADQWMRDMEMTIKDNTKRSYIGNIDRLKEFFQQTLLRDIHIGHIRAYQKMRMAKAGNILINSECSRLQSILKVVRLWPHFASLYRPLPTPKDKVRQNMSEEEERRLYAVALKPGKRLLAGHCLIVMCNTTMGFWELAHLRRQDVKLDVDIPFVEVNAEAGGAKNKTRERTIPLNFMALKSIKWIIDRWRKAGGTDFKQYILFHRAQRRHAEIDFNKPMGHIYKAARQIFAEAGLAHLDPYDMRSHAITKILSNPKVSPQVAQEIAGHISKKMQDRYSAQRLENKKIAMDAFGSGGIMEAAALLDEIAKS